MAYESCKIYTAMLVVQAIYAGTALLSKASISSGMNPFIFVVYRQAFATLALSPFAYFFERKKAPRLSYSLILKTFFSSLIGITISLNLYYQALNHTSATFAAAATNLAPTTTFVIALILRIERMYIKELHGWVKLIGSAVSVSGALVFAFVKGPTLSFMTSYISHAKASSATNRSSSNENFKGPLLILLANVLWSCWSTMQAFIVKEYPAKISLIAIQCFFSFIQSTIIAIAMERNISSWKLGWDVNLISVVYCVWTLFLLDHLIKERASAIIKMSNQGVIVTAFTFWLQLWSIEKRGPVFTAMFTPLSLIITATISMFLWKETLYLGSVCGFVLLAGGLYCVLWGKSKELDGKICEQKVEEPKTTLDSIKTQE